MDDSGYQVGQGLGRILIPVALLIWGMRKCETIAARPGANVSGARGLMFALGGWALLLIVTAFQPVFPWVVGALAYGAVTLLCLAGAALSVKGLLAWSGHKEGNGQGVFGLLIGLGLGGVVAFSFAQGMWRASKPDLASAEFLAKVAASASQSMPRKVDDETEISSVQAQQGLLVYNYKLLNYAAAQLDIQKVTAAMKPKLVASGCSSKETRELLTAGVTLRYVYVDKEGGPVVSIDVGRGDCPPAP